MDPILGSALISAGSNLVGSLLGGKNNHAGRDQRQAISFANRSAVLDKVAAAKEAGISPLYALGAPTISASSAVGDTGEPLGTTISKMGADVSRAVAAGQSQEERQLTALALEKAGLENELLRAQTSKVKADVLNSVPALPSEQVTPPQRTPQLKVGGSWWKTHPGFSDAQAGTNRYGESELFEMLAGGVVGAADLWWNSQLRAAVNEAASSSPSAARQIYDYLAGRR